MLQGWLSAGGQTVALVLLLVVSSCDAILDGSAQSSLLCVNVERRLLPPLGLISATKATTWLEVGIIGCEGVGSTIVRLRGGGDDVRAVHTNELDGAKGRTGESLSQRTSSVLVGEGGREGGGDRSSSAFRSTSRGGGREASRWRSSSETGRGGRGSQDSMYSRREDSTEGERKGRARATEAGPKVLPDPQQWPPSRFGFEEGRVEGGGLGGEDKGSFATSVGKEATAGGRVMAAAARAEGAGGATISSPAAPWRPPTAPTSVRPIAVAPSPPPPAPSQAPPAVAAGVSGGGGGSGLRPWKSPSSKAPVEQPVAHASKPSPGTKKSTSLLDLLVHKYKY